MCLQYNVIGTRYVMAFLKAIRFIRIGVVVWRLLRLRRNHHLTVAKSSVFTASSLVQRLLTVHCVCVCAVSYKLFGTLFDFYPVTI